MRTPQKHMVSAASCLLLMAALAQAQFYYTASNGVATIVEYAGPGGAVNIPGTINGMPVIIGSYAFDDNASVEVVNISNGVISIEPAAFLNCTSLASVTVPGSVSSIQEYAFYYCTNLTNIVIENGVTDIGPWAFLMDYSLASISIPGSVTNVESYCFEWCTGLKYVTLANGVQNIGGSTFEYCTNLIRVTMPDTVTTIGFAAFFDCTSMPTITIGKGVATMGEYAFNYCTNLTGVYFRGNPPTVDLITTDTTLFYADHNVTVYYLPGTTGWSSLWHSLYCSKPAVLWNAVIGTPSLETGSNIVTANDATASDTAGALSFGFNIVGTPNIPVVVEACSNLANPVWTPLQAVTLAGGSAYFSEPMQSVPGRFYRLTHP